MEAKLIKTNTGYRYIEEEYYPNYREAGIRRVLKDKGYSEQTIDYLIDNCIDENKKVNKKVKENK